jgi:hypothetical protein|tara:strand:- start:161 stop:370 length:210 start_codon:yes stop_codon:yes gene_type:complete
MNPERKTILKEVCLAFAVISIFLSGTSIIVQKVYAHDPGQTGVPTWSPPAIEQCNKPLWDRITDGCKEL